ncbi:tyrosine-type recombinase/integrase [Mycoplasmopsis glycophila]|uniref:Site-specific recombinase XerD n=1 Tax=Mycoplasmopsis glycophila TaxID=171285 RepID=A0A449AV86_9BACT|nr:tyrosine-type recombinase/integrase [Mycoplasmopsis glycophila]VEU70429.1 Site-specific recombinase XerD [Mycoplasmopsis glycophila]
MKYIYSLNHYEPKEFAEFYLSSQEVKNKETARMVKVAFNKFLLPGYIVDIDYINNVKTNLANKNNPNYVRTLTTIIKTFIKTINKRFSMNLAEWNIELPDKIDTIKKSLSIKELDQFFEILKSKGSKELLFYITFLYHNQARSEEFFKVFEEDKFFWINEVSSYGTITRAVKGGENRYFIIPKEYAQTYKKEYQSLKKNSNDIEALKRKMRMQLDRFAKAFIYTLEDWNPNSKITTHIFRHSKATNAYYLGVDPNKISASLGHRPGSETVFNHYIKVDQTYKLEAWKELNEAPQIKEVLTKSQEQHIKELTQTIERFSKREAETLESNKFLKNELDKLRQEQKEQKKEAEQLYKLVRDLTNILENTSDYKQIKIKKHLERIHQKTENIKARSEHF